MLIALFIFLFLIFLGLNFSLFMHWLLVKIISISTEKKRYFREQKIRLKQYLITNSLFLVFVLVILFLFICTYAENKGWISLGLLKYNNLNFPISFFKTAISFFIFVYAFLLSLHILLIVKIILIQHNLHNLKPIKISFDNVINFESEKYTFQFENMMINVKRKFTYSLGMISIIDSWLKAKKFYSKEMFKVFLVKNTIIYGMINSNFKFENTDDQFCFVVKNIYERVIEQYSQYITKHEFVKIYNNLLGIETI